MSQQLNVSGLLTITDGGLVSFDGRVIGDQPTPLPPSGNDQIDLSKAVITRESPDVRGWPIGARLTSLTITDAVVDGPADVTNMRVEFTKRNGASAWPIVNGPEGEIQYTLWCCNFIREVWYAAGSILCISRGQDDNYVPTGPTMRSNQLPGNWYYFAGDPMASHQPMHDEPVAWFLTSGVQRRNDIHTAYGPPDNDGNRPVISNVAERTQVVITPFAPGTYTF